MDAEKLIQLTSQIRLFAGVDLERIKKIVNIAEKKVFHKDQAVFKEGESSDEIFLILRGELLVKNQTTTINVLKDSDVVGEMGVLSKQPRSADVVAVHDCAVLSLHRKALDQLIEGDRELGFQIYKNAVDILCDYLRHNNVILENLAQQAGS